MTYGYLRVSTDEQDINSQRQGVDSLATRLKLQIGEYITDEGVSGGKDPSKRKLGPLLAKVKEGDIILCSEISRLGRDLFMVMEILHHCMKVGAKIYSDKDNYELGDNIQSKVLAFAFGLSAEIERQMIRQRTREGLLRRMKLGVLLGRPLGSPNEDSRVLRIINEQHDDIVYQAKVGVPFRRIAQNFNIDRNTLVRHIATGNLKELQEYCSTKYISEMIARHKSERNTDVFKTIGRKFVAMQLDPDTYEKIKNLILQDKTIPEIHKEMCDYSYEQIYDTIFLEYELHQLYRQHGQKVAMKS